MVKIGKRFINSLLKKDIGKELREKILSEHPLSINDVIINVYKKPLPNKYLASLSKIIKEYIESEEIKELISLSFKSYIDKNISKYKNFTKYEIGFVGSIAYHFSDILSSVMNEAGLIPGKILSQPIDELVLYHNKY